MTRKSWSAWVWGACAGALLLAYVPFFNHVAFHEVGIARNALTGAVWLQSPGWYASAPWTRVAAVDTRPMRVCVSSASRTLSCKLARFEPSAYQEFVKLEGFRYYWWDNRISFNGGYADEHRGVRDLLRGYAYSADAYPFVDVESAL